jgi:hypothetical protein
MLEAYMIALDSRSDYQVRLAVEVEMATPSDWPITANALCSLAGNYAPSAEEAERRYEAERARLALPAPDPVANYSANRQGMREECQRLIDSNEFESAAEGSFAREMLKVLDACDGDPTAEVRKVLFGIRARAPKQRAGLDPVELKSSIAKADEWGAA